MRINFVPIRFVEFPCPRVIDQCGIGCTGEPEDDAVQGVGLILQMLDGSVMVVVRVAH